MNFKILFSASHFRVLFNAFFIALFLLTTPFKGLSQSFEGVVYYQIPELENEIGTSNLDYMIKSPMIRIEYKSGDSPSTSILYESETKTMFIKLGMLGGHVEIPPDEVQENLQRREVTFKQTGTSKTIAEVTCDIWETSFNGNSYRYCFVAEMADFILPINSVTAGSVPEWARVQFPEKHMPLEVVRISSKNKEQLMMKATQIERIRLDKNLFSVFN